MQFNQTNNNGGDVNNLGMPRATTATRRHALLRWTEEMMTSLLIHGTPCTRATGDKLPSDIKIVDVRHDIANSRIELLLESATFAPVEEGERIPVLKAPQFTAFEHAADAREFDRTGKLPMEGSR